MKQTTNQYLNNLMQTMDALVDKRINDAGFDRTIKCTVQSCEDEATGKYKVKFQDQCFYAFATDTSKKIKKNTLVYVLIPNNNMQNIKQIIGTEEQLGENYNEILSPRQQYRVVSPNLFNIKELTINLDRTENNSIGNHSNIALSTDGISRDVNSQSVEDIQILFANENNKPNYLKISGTFVTNNFSESAQEQNSANYGIAIEITKGGQTTYYIDELHFFSGNFSGNPFNFILPSQQEIYIPIPEKIQEALADSDSDITVKLFKENFLQNNQGDISGEIVCSNFNIQLIQKLDSVSLTNYLFLDTVNDNLILHNDSDNIRIKATLSVNNAVASNNVKYYWGIENVGINRYVEYAQQINTNGTGYQKFLGYGWSCLNDSIYVQDNELTVDTRLVQTSNVRFKCVAVYNGELYSNTIEILNNVPNYLIVFTCSNQSGTLIREGKILTSNDVEGSLPTGWSYDAVCTGFRALGSSTSLTISSYLLQKNAISGKYQFVNNSNQTYTQNWGYFEQGDDTYHQIHQYTQWININSVQTVRQYKVTYAQSTNVCGTGAFDIRFQNQINAVPYLHMINGSQTFLYSETGHSPADDKYFTNPQTIYDISFNLIDGDSVLSANDAQITDIVWKIPKDNTMLDVNRIKARFSDNDSYFGNDENYYIISREIFPDQASLILNLPIYIQKTYNFNYVNNQILLQVTCNDFIYTAETAFIFSHQGETGTNGTEMLCKIYLFDNDQVIDDSSTPIINVYLGSNSGNRDPSKITYSWKSNNGNNVINSFAVICKLFRNGECIVDSSQSLVDYSIQWSISKNIYGLDNNNLTIEDPSWLYVGSGQGNPTNGVCYVAMAGSEYSAMRNFLNGRFSSDSYDSSISILDVDNYPHPANNIKCTLTDTKTKKQYTAILPIIFILHGGSDESSSNLIELSNFDLRQIMYNNNGEFPSYNTSNEIKIKGFNNAGFHNSQLCFLGSYYSKQTGGYNNWHASEVLQRTADVGYSIDDTISSGSFVYAEEITINKLQAVNKYNGIAKNTGLAFWITGQGVSCIVLPIHAYLNTYGLSALNGWDGEAMSIDDKGKFLLAPQVGAGSKDASNLFTGVVMGTVLDSKETANAQANKTGLFAFGEGKQTFFLDANTGNAEFGSVTSGKIQIIPNNNNNNELVIQSSDYAESGSSIGGLKINFGQKPFIKFGTNNFSVDKDGKITATNATITGTIKATSGVIGGTTGQEDGSIVIQEGAIGTWDRFGDNHELANNSGFYLGKATRYKNDDIYGSLKIGTILSIGGHAAFGSGGRPTSTEDYYKHCYFLVTMGGKAYIREGTFTNCTYNFGSYNYGHFQSSYINQSYIIDGINIMTGTNGDIRGNISATSLQNTGTGIIEYITKISSENNNILVLESNNRLHLKIKALYVNDDTAFNTSHRGLSTSVTVDNQTLKFTHGILTAVEPVQTS